MPIGYRNHNNKGGDHILPIKRPRGRPPLSIKRKYEALDNTTNNNTIKSGISHHSPFGGPSISIGHEHRAFNSQSKDLDKKNSKSSAQAIVDVLMTNEPLTLTEIIKRIPEATKEIIVSSLEVLQVLGIAMQLKVKDPVKSKLCLAYTLVGFCRGANAVSIRQISEVTDEKLENIKKIQYRIQKLEKLVHKTVDTPDIDISPDFQNILTDIKCDPLQESSQNDPLYQHLNLKLSVCQENK